ncbi:hypothetical protein DSCO28_26110 [Desulfosarcina ovata subsp. sediminis]|uniref:DUF1302 domain-containing protein n=2 Tax=Desulfosarcina ovata TaxID=83564 RepID=A0A5K7ZNF1_9BACT|nr:hypothetical protein DSCO28_26110 [Desulfosarcina ovata subsp. sediminis]
MKPRKRRLSAFKPMSFRGKFGFRTAVMMVAVVSAFLCGNSALAYQFKTSPDWSIYLDNTIQYTIGMRAQEMNDKIGNHLNYNQGDYKFKDRGDIVTNRIQDLIEFQADYQRRLGLRVSGSVWKDFAYDDDAEVNPNHPGFAEANAYPSGEYSSYTKRYFMQGGEFLDAFTYWNTQILGKPTYLKAGRLTQYWGNAFFLGNSAISYSQHPTDIIKAFTQPGSEVKELFLPRAQVLCTTELSPELAVSAQYFFEFGPNRYPEGGTYLEAAAFLFNGPPGAFGTMENDGYVEPDDVNDNFGVKVAWSPIWANGELSFYYRQFDEVNPWAGLVNPDTGHLQATFAENVKLVGLAYERVFGLVSMGFELNTRFDTALQTLSTAPPTNEGATGTVTSFIANTMIQLGTTPLYDCGTLIAEINYSYLNEVTGNDDMYKDEDLLVHGWKEGGATRNYLAFAMSFEPQWLQVLPSVDFSMPMSLQTGLYGNPAHASAAALPQESFIYSIGVKATIKSKHYITLSYNGYHFRTGSTEENNLGLDQYAYGNGSINYNDRGWVELQFKTSF